jgi:hypothetical protein
VNFVYKNFDNYGIVRIQTDKMKQRKHSDIKSMLTANPILRPTIVNVTTSVTITIMKQTLLVINNIY